MFNGQSILLPSSMVEVADVLPNLEEGPFLNAASVAWGEK
jgi:hypothetical protein